MRFAYQRITFIKIRKPARKDVNESLQWLGSSLGLFSLRDKDKSCFRIFIELLKCTKRGKSLSSDELADRLNLTRGTVVHHLNKLIASGLVVTEGRSYLLRVDTLSDLVDELEKDVNRTIGDMRKVADELDRIL